MLRKKLKICNEEKLESSSQCDNKNYQEVITSNLFPTQFWQKLYNIELHLNVELNSLTFKKPVAAVYNPVDYAKELHCDYLRKFLNGPKQVLFIGMNPGPWGMCQTGVPFGYIPAVRDWLQLKGEVEKPLNELPCRPVDGLLCKKAEQSGQRFWGLLEDICKQPETFFSNCFIYNLCPLAFFHSSGRNITPADLKGDEKRLLQKICMKSLQEAIDLIQPTIIISIGRYVDDRVKELLKKKLLNAEIALKCIPHPSPRSVNNTNWNEKAKQWFIDNNIIQFLVESNLESN